MKLRERIAILAAFGVLAGGCGNASDLLGVPKKQKPIAVITGPAGPLAALGQYQADGSASHDPDGTIVAWHWTVSQKPAGSGISLVASPGAPASQQVQFRPDLLGGYEIRLVVTDNSGLDSDPAVYDFDANDNSGLRLELTWDMDYVDVDLHLVNESAGGAFFTEPYDSYFQNLDPDWGVAGNTDDDPLVADKLTFDHDEGYGPEVMGIHAPAAGSYRVMAHYYCDDGIGGTSADMKIYLNGVLAAEATRTVVHTGDLWDVATVVFDTAGNPTLSVSSAGLATNTGHGCQ